MSHVLVQRNGGFVNVRMSGWVFSTTWCGGQRYICVTLRAGPLVFVRFALSDTEGTRVV